MVRHERERESGATALQTALLLAGALAIAVLVALALLQWFGRLS